MADGAVDAGGLVRQLYELFKVVLGYPDGGASGEHGVRVDRVDEVSCTIVPLLGINVQPDKVHSCSDQGPSQYEAV